VTNPVVSAVAMAVHVWYNQFMSLVGPAETRSAEIHRVLRAAILDGSYGPDAALSRGT
jgi:hypothetical protein